jgi:ribosome recycling factor
MDNVDDILLDTESKMEKSFEFMHDQMLGIRTGKASPALVENIKADYYGAPTRIMEIAGISTPEPRLIVINAFDPTALPEIEKAILAANLGVTPMNDGRVIRIPIPELNQERREELTKVSKRLAEECRVAIRNERRDANDQLKALQKKAGISEDERDTGLEQIQKDTDIYVKKVDEKLKAKEEEIMSV